MATNLTSKGQVTVAKKIRDYLGLKAGAAVTFQRLENGEIASRAAKVTAKPGASKFAKLRGRGTVRMKTEDILALSRADWKEASLAIEDIPREALFLAGKAFLRYRRARGTKRSVLPEFYIGAHAALMQWPVLTRDVARYRTYFPTVPLIAP